MTQFEPADLLGITQPGDGLFRRMPWLEETRKAREAFFFTLVKLHLDRCPASLKSNMHSGVDLYHDAVLRHLAHNANRPALLYQTMDSQAVRVRSSLRNAGNEKALWSCLSYQELHEACTARCQKWQAKQLKAGDALCIISDVEPELLIALLSGLRMGLKVTVLPPRGLDFLHRRIQAVPDAKISTPLRYSSLLSPFHDRCLFVEELPTPILGIDHHYTSHTYSPKDSVFALFSPFDRWDDKNTGPTELRARDVLLSLMRDGLLHLSLWPGSTVAAPGSDSLQYVPLLILCCLFHGGAYVHCDPLSLHNSLVEKSLPCELHVLLVGEQLRDSVLIEHPRARPWAQFGLRLCLIEALSPEGMHWNDFVHRADLRDTECQTWLYDSAIGGCLLFSLRRKGAFSRFLRVSPVRTYTLEYPGTLQGARTGTESVTEPETEPETETNAGSSRKVRLPSEIGVLNSHKRGCGLLLSSQEGGYLYCGTYLPSKRGRPYPAQEVTDVVQKLPFLAASLVVCEPGDRGGIVLLLFTGPEPLTVARELNTVRESIVREVILQRLGSSALPDFIEQFAMFPRMNGKEVDAAFCEREFLRGTLRDREEEPTFRLLDALRVTTNATVLNKRKGDAQRDTKKGELNE